jgi:hypothetical protein
LRIYPDPNGTNALVINTTTDFNTLLDNKVTGPLPSLAGYLNNVINDSRRHEYHETRRSRHER